MAGILHVDNIILKGVYHVSEFNKKIISIRQLVKDNYEVTFKKSSCEVKMPSGAVLTINNNNNNNLYYINGQAMPSELTEEINTQTVKYKKTMDINKAHKKLGHIAEKGVRKTLQAMGITPTGTMMKCEACAMSKAKQKPVKKFTAVRSSTPGECLFIDTAGLYHVGVGGVKYWVQVVDNYTRIEYCFFHQIQK